MYFMETTLEKPVDGRHKRVLIIEDELMMAMMLDYMLTGLGYDSAGTAQCLDEALSKIDQESFEAVILDVNLNGQSTFDLAEVLEKKHVPFVFSTGYDKDVLPEKYRYYPILQKPYSQAQLGNRLNAILAA